MNEVEIDALATPDLDAPVFIEGLPGIGLVGKLAVDHLIEERECEPVREVYSEYFPPAVSVDDEGRASLVSVTVYGLETDGRDLLVLAGDSQAQEAVGQYRLAEAVLDIAEEFDAREIVTLGGFATGEPVEEYLVVGAVTDGSEALKEQLATAGVSFGRDGAPGNIVGMSGLLLGLGARRGIPAAGLLGITSGYHVDPASARSVLEVLQDVFGFSVDLDTLAEQAEQIQEMLDQLQEVQRQQHQPTTQSGEDLRYFG